MNYENNEIDIDITPPNEQTKDEGMQIPEGPPLQTLLLFLEGPSGVLQVVVGLFDDQTTLRLVALDKSKVAGQPPAVDRERIDEAIRLNDWAHRNPDVIREGKVTY